MSSGTLHFEAFGVLGSVLWRGLPAGWGDRVRLAWPPTARERLDDLATGPRLAARIRADGQGWRLDLDGCDPDGASQRTADPDELAHLLESALGLGVAELSPDAVFVHAGVVGTPRGAVLFPATSFSGKTTLVAELLRVGCSYLSDEYAVLTPDGLVAPYHRRLSLRTATGRARRTPDDLGATPSGAMQPHAVVTTRYEPGARTWLHEQPAGDTLLSLVSNAVACRTRPRAVMSSCAAVARRARGLVGVRGEASEAAPDILALLS